jgi:hypothetical protein
VASASTHASLLDLAEGTGGFLVTDSGKASLAKVMDAAQSHYELTYRPASDSNDGRFHKIEVKLAREDLRVEARNGYYAVPETPGGGGLTPLEMAGFRALNTQPAPHEFDYRAAALHFRDASGRPDVAVAFDIPMKNLTARTEGAEKRYSVHVSLLAVVKDSSNQIVDRFGIDTPTDVTDAEWNSSHLGHVMFEHSLPLAPGHYTVETAVVDWESGRSSTGAIELDCAASPGPQISSAALVRSVQPGDPAADDPMVYQGKRIVPALFNDLESDARPAVFFRVYPDRNDKSKTRLRAQIVLDGKVIADQVADLGEPDSSGGIPVLIQAAARPGKQELKLTALQGTGSAQREIQYSVAAK